MNILVDLAHPAHFHFFGPAIRRWREDGHRVVLTARKKDILLDLVTRSGETPIIISGIRRGRLGQMQELLLRITRLVPLIIREKIDVLTAVGGVSVAHAAWLTGRPSLIWTNNENARLSNRITLPFATTIATPTSFRGDWGKKHRRYRGNHERAYIPLKPVLIPREQLRQWGIDPDQHFSLVRLVSWQASHDKGHHGLSCEEALRLIHHLEQYGQVVLNVEGDCPVELSTWLRAIPPERMREVLAHAAFYIGEGATMASEAALLGVPNIFYSTIRLGYLDELQDKYGLMLCTDDLNLAIHQIDLTLGNPDFTTNLQKNVKLFFTETDKVADLVYSWVLDQTHISH